MHPFQNAFVRSFLKRQMNFVSFRIKSLNMVCSKGDVHEVREVQNRFMSASNTKVFVDRCEQFVVLDEIGRLLGHSPLLSNSGVQHLEVMALIPVTDGDAIANFLGGVVDFLQELAILPVLCDEVGSPLELEGFP